jgi:DNA-binding NarL/FixJ family response regulator
MRSARSTTGNPCSSRPPSAGSRPRRGGPGRGLAEANLTDREAEVLRLIAQGRSNSEIAAELFLGVETVKTHVRNVLAKLGARDRVQAVITAYESGFIR